MRHIEHKQALAFVTICAEGSIRAAAQYPGIEPSTISRQIQALEKSLSITLIERGCKGIRTTEAGALLLQHLKWQPHELDDIQSEFDALRGMRRGQIVVILGDGFVSDFIAHALPGFTASYPGFTFSLQTGSTDTVLHALRNDQAHIGIVFKAPKDQTIRVIGETTQPLDMVVSPSSVWAGPWTFGNRVQVLGLVGESGSGKSTLGRLLTGLLTPTSGDIEFTEHGPLSGLNTKARRKAFRRDVQVIFQDPYSSLNGRMRVARILTERILFHGPASRREVSRLVAALLERVGLPADAARKHPHQFSGGQRQRICIARAQSVRPRFLLCDEPTSALDVPIQADRLALLMELKQSLGLTMLFVSHDLAVVRQVSDRVTVMRNSQFVESGPAEDVFDSTASDYTRLLLDTAPRLDQHTQSFNQQ